jgi:hypothetical protein
MGLETGTLTFFRLRFDEKIKLSISEITKILEEWTFDKIYNDDNLTNYGFVPLKYPEFNDFKIAEICFEQTYIFAMRMDEKKLNKQFFNIELSNKKKEFLIQSNKNNISKSDIEFIKNSLLLTMSKKTLPVTSIIEIIFKPEKNIILVSKISNKIFDALEHLFKAAFDIVIYRDSIINTAKSQQIVPEDIDALLKTNATQF